MPVEVDGIEDVLWALKEMEGAAQSEVLADAGMFAMEPVRKLASMSAPRRTGALSRDMTKEVTEKGMGRAVVDVGPDEKDFYALFIERGWKPRGSSTKSTGSGRVAPRPFLRPAIDQAKDTVFDWFAQHISQWFDSHIR